MAGSPITSVTVVGMEGYRLACAASWFLRTLPCSIITPSTLSVPHPAQCHLALPWMASCSLWTLPFPASSHPPHLRSYIPPDIDLYHTPPKHTHLHHTPPHIHTHSITASHQHHTSITPASHPHHTHSTPTYLEPTTLTLALTDKHEDFF